MIALGDILVEIDVRLGRLKEPDVLTLTEKRGFVRQIDRFNKRLATDDTQNYKVVARYDLAFNPYLLWAGAIAINTVCDQGIVSPAYPTFRVRPAFDPMYVWNLLSSVQMSARYDQIAFGAVPRRRRTSVQDFLDLMVADPPDLAEQRRIADILDRADALRAKRRAAIERWSLLGTAVFSSAFGDPLTNPRGWSITSLDDCSIQVTDGEHLTPLRTSSGIKLLSARNVRDGFLDFGNVDFIGPAEYQRIRRRCEPVRGDVLISCSGSIGRVAPVETDEPFALVRSAALVRPDTNAVRTPFLHYMLRTPAVQRQMARSANASSQANLFQKQIRELSILRPPLELQDTFAEKMGVVDQEGAKQRASLSQLDALVASVQHRAFRGEL